MMKYPSLFFIINVFVISVIFSTVDSSSDPDVRNVYSTAKITIKDIKKPPEESDSALSADIEFTDDDGNNIIEAEDGSSISFNIKVNSDQFYKNGRVKQCIMIEKDNKMNTKELCNECSKDESIGDFEWKQEIKTFQTNLQVMKLPDSKSNEYIIECSAIVCKDLCPERSCPSTDKRRKRRGIFKKPLALYFRARKAG
ncbi:uncharacterized protein [Chelonus insularis]|uniref:uncharacterized protein n=1 Tax=Chelonus insularis TaxID=460826 RepID=UPI00158C4F4C|nr:uncharacterized protein LOC118074506 [Chelonus insularis]